MKQEKKKIEGEEEITAQPERLRKIQFPAFVRVKGVSQR